MGHGTYHTPPGCSQSMEPMTTCGHGGQVQDSYHSSQAFMMVTEDCSGHSVLLQRHLSGKAGRPFRNSPHISTFQPAQSPFRQAVSLVVFFCLPPYVHLPAPLRRPCVSASLVHFSLSPAPPSSGSIAFERTHSQAGPKC